MASAKANRTVRRFALWLGESMPDRPSLEDEMSRTPNDDRSDSMNPNNDAYWSSLDNHSNQLNPNNEAYDGPPATDDEE